MLIIPLSQRPDMVEAVAQWIHDEWAWFSGRSRAETVERFTGETADQELPHTVIAIDADIPLGAATLRERDSYDWLPNRGPWICNVYVTAEARGRSVALKLCSALINYAKKIDAKEVYLSTEMGKDSLYHRLGFQEITRTILDDKTHYILSIRTDS